MGKKIFINKKYKDKTKKYKIVMTKTIEKAEPNLIEITVRAKTYPVCD